METFTSQVAPAARTPPERLMILVPGIAPKVPPQVFGLAMPAGVGGLATTSPSGKTAWKLRPLKGIAPATRLSTTKVRVTGVLTGAGLGRRKRANRGEGPTGTGVGTGVGPEVGVGTGGRGVGVGVGVG